MITRVTVPKLTLTMEGGTVVRWLREEGDTVHRNEPLLELETDKAVVEIPAPNDGLLKKILVRAGDVSVGKTVAFIADHADELTEVQLVPESAQGQMETADVVPHLSIPQSTSGGSIIRATPAARRRARELNVDLGQIRGTGPEGRIVQEDVERTPIEQGLGGLTSSRSIRSVIAKRITESWRTVPHIHLGAELKGVGLRSALERARNMLGPELTITDILLYTLGSLLPRFPVLNSVWNDARAEVRPDVHLAFAVQTDRGVITPVIHYADRHGLQRISLERRRLTEAARARRVKLQEIEGGTFTLTNLGMYPVDFFVPIINYPQSAVLAVGRLRQIVEMRNGTAVAVEHMWVNLAVDHRVADGALGAEFLQALQNRLDTLDDEILAR